MVSQIGIFLYGRHVWRPYKYRTYVSFYGMERIKKIIVIHIWVNIDLSIGVFIAYITP